MFKNYLKITFRSIHSGLVAAIIAMITISSLAIKAATANTVESLRYE